MNNYGERIDESTVRFERLLPGPIDRVWSYLTESDKRAQWLAGGETEAKVGGLVELHFHNKSLSSQPDIPPPEKYRDFTEKMSFSGRVVHYDPPNALTHTWEFHDEHSEVSYELEEVGDKVRLTLTHRRLASRDEVLSVSGGWHTHLDILEDVLQGAEPRPFWKTHMALEAEYDKRL